MPIYKLLDLSEGRYLSMCHYTPRDPNVYHSTDNIPYPLNKFEFDDMKEVIKAIEYYTVLIGKRKEWLEIIEVE